MQAKPSSEEECVSSSDDSDESSDEVSLPDDSSEEDRPSRKQSRSQHAPTANEAKPQVSSRPTAALPTAADGHGFASLLQSQETPKATTEKEENTPQAPAVRPPLQSLSLLDRLRLGGGNSFSSAAPIRTKQLTLDEIFAPTGSSAAKPSNSSKPAQLMSTSATHTM